MQKFAKEEISNLTIEKENIEKELEVLLLPHDPNDEKNVIVEIRGAAGGDEANIFAGDLFDMYTHYANNFGWKIETLSEGYYTTTTEVQIPNVIEEDKKNAPLPPKKKGIFKTYFKGLAEKFKLCIPVYGTYYAGKISNETNNMLKDSKIIKAQNK
jgi:hypothetical protein